MSLSLFYCLLCACLLLCMAQTLQWSGEAMGTDKSPYLMSEHVVLMWPENH